MDSPLGDELPAATADLKRLVASRGRFLVSEGVREAEDVAGETSRVVEELDEAVTETNVAGRGPQLKGGRRRSGRPRSPREGAAEHGRPHPARARGGR